MGGSIALTMRFSDATEWRGSCHTNALPLGLFDAPFYDPTIGEHHARKWLDSILENRRAEPQLEKNWGGWHKLAPEGYGLIVVDYLSDTLISHQGYSAPNNAHLFGNDCDNRIRWNDLNAAGRLYDIHSPYTGATYAKIKMPFATSICGLEDSIGPETLTWAAHNFELSPAERRAWARFFRRLEE